MVQWNEDKCKLEWGQFKQPEKDTFIETLQMRKFLSLSKELDFSNPLHRERFQEYVLQRNALEYVLQRNALEYVYGIDFKEDDLSNGGR